MTPPPLPPLPRAATLFHYFAPLPPSRHTAHPSIDRTPNTPNHTTPQIDPPSDMDTSTSPSLHGDTQEEIHTPLPQDTTHSTYMPTTNSSHPAEPQNLFQPHIPIDLTTPHSTPYTLHPPPPTQRLRPSITSSKLMPRRKRLRPANSGHWKTNC